MGKTQCQTVQYPYTIDRDEALMNEFARLFGKLLGGMVRGDGGE